MALLHQFSNFYEEMTKEKWVNLGFIASGDACHEGDEKNAKNFHLYHFPPQCEDDSPEGVHPTAGVDMLTAEKENSLKGTNNHVHYISNGHTMALVECKHSHISEKFIKTIATTLGRTKVHTKYSISLGLEDALDEILPQMTTDSMSQLISITVVVLDDHDKMVHFLELGDNVSIVARQAIFANNLILRYDTLQHNKSRRKQVTVGELFKSLHKTIEQNVSKYDLKLKSIHVKEGDVVLAIPNSLYKLFGIDRILDFASDWYYTIYTFKERAERIKNEQRVGARMDAERPPELAAPLKRPGDVVQESLTVRFTSDAARGFGELLSHGLLEEAELAAIEHKIPLPKYLCATAAIVCANENRFLHNPKVRVEHRLASNIHLSFVEQARMGLAKAGELVKFTKAFSDPTNHSFQSKNSSIPQLQKIPVVNPQHFREAISSIERKKYGASPPPPSRTIQQLDGTDASPGQSPPARSIPQSPICHRPMIIPTQDMYPVDQSPKPPTAYHIGPTTPTPTVVIPASSVSHTSASPFLAGKTETPGLICSKVSLAKPITQVSLEDDDDVDFDAHANFDNLPVSCYVELAREIAHNRLAFRPHKRIDPDEPIPLCDDFDFSSHGASSRHTNDINMDKPIAVTANPPATNPLLIVGDCDSPVSSNNVGTPQESLSSSGETFAATVVSDMKVMLQSNLAKPEIARNPKMQGQHAFSSLPASLEFEVEGGLETDDWRVNVADKVLTDKKDSASTIRNMALLPTPGKMVSRPVKPLTKNLTSSKLNAITAKVNSYAFNAKPALPMGLNGLVKASTVAESSNIVAAPSSSSASTRLAQKIFSTSSIGKATERTKQRAATPVFKFEESPMRSVVEPGSNAMSPPRNSNLGKTITRNSELIRSGLTKRTSSIRSNAESSSRRDTGKKANGSYRASLTTTASAAKVGTTVRSSTPLVKVPNSSLSRRNVTRLSNSVSKPSVADPNLKKKDSITTFERSTVPTSATTHAGLSGRIAVPLPTPLSIISKSGAPQSVPRNGTFLAHNTRLHVSTSPFRELSRQIAEPPVGMTQKASSSQSPQLSSPATGLKLLTPPNGYRIPTGLPPKSPALVEPMLQAPGIGDLFPLSAKRSIPVSPSPPTKTTVLSARPSLIVPPPGSTILPLPQMSSLPPHQLPMHHQGHCPSEYSESPYLASLPPMSYPSSPSVINSHHNAVAFNPQLHHNMQFMPSPVHNGFFVAHPGFLTQQSGYPSPHQNHSFAPQQRQSYTPMNHSVPPPPVFHSMLANDSSQVKYYYQPYMQ